MVAVDAFGPAVSLGGFSGGEYVMRVMTGHRIDTFCVGSFVNTPDGGACGCK